MNGGDAAFCLTEVWGLRNFPNDVGAQECREEAVAYKCCARFWARKNFARLKPGTGSRIGRNSRPGEQSQAPKRARIPVPSWPDFRLGRTESGPKNEPGFRSQNWDRNLTIYKQKQINGPDSGPNFGTGIRDHFWDRVLFGRARKSKKSGPDFRAVFCHSSFPPSVASESLRFAFILIALAPRLRFN